MNSKIISSDSGPPACLRVAEIFYSLQGETQYAGRPCVFVRLSGCPHRCTYCDTVRALTGGEEMSIGDVVARVNAQNVRLVEVTGGEPLHQSATPLLLQRLLEEGHEVLLETSGHEALSRVPSGAHIVMDIKTPGSGAEGFRAANLKRLGSGDALKIVICSREDFEWAADLVRRRLLLSRSFPVYFCPAQGFLEVGILAEWILEARLPVHLGIQLHKLLWGAQTTR